MALTGRLLLHVVVWRVGDIVAREDFAARHVIAGCDPLRADLVVAPDAPGADAGIAGEHALLQHDGERVRVHALSDALALRVNGVRVEAATVHPDDDVALGNCILRLRLLSAAAAERWRQTLAEEDAAHPPPWPSDSAAAADTPALPGPEPEATRRLLQRAPRAARRALLAPLPASVVRILEGPPTAGRRSPGLALLKLGQGLADFRLVRRPYSIPATYLTVGRYETRTRVPSPLRLRASGRGRAEALIPAGVPWLLTGPEGTVDETQGLRDGRVRRRRGRVRLILKSDDTLRIYVAPGIYVARMVALPEPPTRTQFNLRTAPRAALAAFAARLRPRLPAAVAATLALGCLALVVLLGGPGPRAGHDPAQKLVPPGRRAPAVLEAHILATAKASAMDTGPGAAARVTEPVHAPLPGGQAGVLGNSTGYRVFGMILPEPVEDPAGISGATVKLAADKAWLRGTDRSAEAWRKVLESVVGGPPWVLDADPADITVSDPKIAPREVSRWLLTHPEVWLGCHDATRPPAQKARPGAVLTLSADGRVRAVKALTRPNDNRPGDGTDRADAARVRCLHQQRGKWRTPRFKGRDVTVRATVTLWPWPS